MYYDYFLRYGYSTSWPKFLRVQLPREQPENFLNFWISQIWCHSIEMNMSRMMTGSIWFDHAWFPRNLNFLILLCFTTLTLCMIFTQLFVNFIFPKLYHLWENPLVWMLVPPVWFFDVYFSRYYFSKFELKFYFIKEILQKLPNFPNHIPYGRGRDSQILDPTIMKTYDYFPRFVHSKFGSKFPLGQDSIDHVQTFSNFHFL